MAVERKTVETQPKQQHVTSTISQFKIQIIAYMMVCYVTICDRSSYFYEIVH